MNNATSPGLWRKDGAVAEKVVYDAIGRYPHGHPRIVPYHGLDLVTSSLLLQRMENGNVSSYLSRFPDTSSRTRMLWAVEIAEAVAYLHSQAILWNDLHLGNVLVTDDMHVVICDFEQALINPKHHFYDSGPPLPYLVPRRGIRTPFHRDIFAFGVLLFVLACRRYPHCDHDQPSFLEAAVIFSRHQEFIYDTVDDPGFQPFRSIVYSCLNLRYSLAEELLTDLQRAYSSWEDALVKGDIPDPDQRRTGRTVL